MSYKSTSDVCSTVFCSTFDVVYLGSRFFEFPSCTFLTSNNRSALVDTQIMVNSSTMHESEAVRPFRIPNIIVKITMQPLARTSAGRIRVMPPPRGDRDGVIGLGGPLPRCDGERMDRESSSVFHGITAADSG